MTLDWQDMAAVAIAGLAAGYLGRQGWRTLVKRRGGCGSCAACPIETGSPPTALVQLGSLESMPKRGGLSASENRSPQALADKPLVIPSIPNKAPAITNDAVITK